jgi:hypothetical protein
MRQRHWEDLKSILPLVMFIIIVSVVVAMCTNGCSSATRTISRNAQIVAAEAPKLALEADAIDGILLGTDYADPARVSTDRIRGSAGVIDKAAGGIRDRVPDIQDRPSTLGKLFDALGWWGKALLVLAIVVFLWYVGVGSLVRRIFISVGLFIPTTKINRARMLTRTLDAGDDEEREHNLRESIAAMRSRDPEFDAAWERVRTEERVR